MNPKKKISSIKIPSAKNEDQPATRKMLRLVRDELKSEIRSLGLKFESRFAGFESRLTGFESRFKSIDSRFIEIDSRFIEMDAKFESRFEEMRAEQIRTNVLLEEQHANNRIVLEGLQALWQRQDRIEGKLA